MGELIVDSQDGVARGVNHPRSAIDDQLARMSALLEAAKHAQAKFEEQSGNEATPVTVHFAALGPQFRSKAQRFLFEQRGRVLARIGQRVPALPADLLDLADESNRVMAIKLPPLASDVEASQFRESLLHQVRSLHELLSASLAAAVAARESPEQLAERIRSIYNHASSANAVPIRKAIVPAQSSSTNK